MHISTIFFDLGSTLVYSRDPWLPIYKRADRALLNALTQAGYPLDPAAIQGELGTFILTYYFHLGKQNIEPTTFATLTGILKANGFPDCPAEVVRGALAALYSVTQANWYREDDAIPTLEKLTSKGYTLGLISNTSNDMNVQGILDRQGLRPFFKCIVTSAGLGIRKPEAAIFQAALDELHVTPAACAMVGDLLSADVLGANRMGIYSIWITRRTEIPDDGELPIQPQAVITALDQLPGLLADLENED